jgi:hypothetical protein
VNSPFSGFKIYDPADGLEVNKLVKNRKVCRFRYYATQFDNEGVFVDDPTSRYLGREAGIVCRVGRINGYKSQVNDEKELVNRRM